MKTQREIEIEHVESVTKASIRFMQETLEALKDPDITDTQFNKVAGSLFKISSVLLHMAFDEIGKDIMGESDK